MSVTLRVRPYYGGEPNGSRRRYNPCKAGREMGLNCSCPKVDIVRDRDTIWRSEPRSLKSVCAGNVSAGDLSTSESFFSAG